MLHIDSKSKIKINFATHSLHEIHNVFCLLCYYSESTVDNSKTLTDEDGYLVIQETIGNEKWLVYATEEEGKNAK